MASVCNLDDPFMGQHNMSTVYIKQHTKATPRNQFPVTFMNKNLIRLPSEHIHEGRRELRGDLLSSCPHHFNNGQSTNVD